MAATVGELNVKLNLELNRLDGQITAANKKIANMGRRMNSDISKAARSINTALSTLGVGLGVGAIVGFGREILSLGGKINDLSMQAGIGTDAFQTLSAVGKESGVTGEQIAQAFVRMGATIQEAAEGSKTAVDSLEKLKLTAAGLKALKPEEQFEAIAIQISQATDKEKAFNAALEILGAKTAPKLREVLARLGTEGFDKLGESTANLRFTPEQIKTLDDAGDKLQRIADIIKILTAKKILEVSDKSSRLAKRVAENTFESLVVAAAGPAAWWLYSMETVGEQAERGGGSTRNPGRSRSPQTAPLTESQASIVARMAAAENEARTLKEISELEKARAELALRFGPDISAIKEMDAASEQAIADALKEQAEVEKAQAEYASKYGPDYSAIKDLPDEPEAPKVTDYQKFQDQVYDIFDNVGDRAASTFADMILTGENAFKSLVDVVARSMLEMIARLAIINPLMNMVFGLGGAGTGTTALATLGSVFGGGKASGGSVSAGKTYLVGEQGMELFSPNTSGSIIPNNKLGGGGGGVSNYYSIDARGASVDAIRELRMQMSALNSSIEVRAVAANRDADRRRK